MSDTPTKTKNPTVGKGKNANMQINASAVRELAEILRDTHLTEIEYETESGRIRVAKELAVPQHIQHHSPVSYSTTAAPAPTQTVQESQAVATGPDWVTHPGLVRAPMVGTVYMSSQPGSAPFVQEEKVVKEGDTLLIIEAMKVMNPIKSPRAGTVKKIIIANGEPVEYDQPLLVIE